MSNAIILFYFTNLDYETDKFTSFNPQSFKKWNVFQNIIQIQCKDSVKCIHIQCGLSWHRSLSVILHSSTCIWQNGGWNVIGKILVLY